MTTIEPSVTDRVLAFMLTENTGRHFLDSGGAYGRNWERNQGRTVEDFLAAPTVTVHSDWVTLDVFHYLRERLTYDRARTRAFTKWATTGERADQHWLACMEQWAADHHTRGRYSDDYWAPGGFNSYNDDNLLSQDIQGDPWTEDGDPFVLLQIHGGCDIRGGYTAPRVFAVTCDEPYSLLDWCRFTVSCHAFPNESAVEADREAHGPLLPGMKHRPAWSDVHRWDAMGASEWVDYGGSYASNPWGDADFIGKDAEGHPVVLCPRCGSPCDVYEYPA
jgi:hypothetical protein